MDKGRQIRQSRQVVWKGSLVWMHFAGAQVGMTLRFNKPRLALNTYPNFVDVIIYMQLVGRLLLLKCPQVGHGVAKGAIYLY